MTPQDKLLKAIKKNPNATMRELQKEAGMSSTSVVDYHLNKLLAKQKIRRGKKWEIIEQD